MRYTIGIVLGILLLASSGCDKNAQDLSKIDEIVEKEVNIANNFLEEGNPGEALEVLEKLQDKVPNNIKVLEAMAYTYSDMGDPGLAAFYYEQIVNANPQLHEFKIFAAQAYAENSDWGESARNYESYLQAFPSDRGTWIALGENYKKSKDWEGAISAFEQAADLTKTSETKMEGTLMVQLGDLYMKTKNVDQAKVHYYKGLKLLPRNPQALSTLLKIEVHTGNFALAEKLLHTLETSEISDVDAHFIQNAKSRVLAWRKEQDRINQEKKAQMERERLAQEEETALFESKELEAEAVTEDPVDIAEDEAQAIEISEPQAQAATPKPSAKKFIERAQQLRKEGAYEKAVDSCWKAVTMDSKVAQYWSELAHNCYLLGNLDDAEMAALEGLRLDNNHMNTKLNYLNIIKAKYSPMKYLSELEQAHQEFRDNADITLMLADHNYETEGNRLRAKELYKKFLSKISEHKDKERVEKLLSYL